MNFIISCLHSNELLLYSEPLNSVVKRRKLLFDNPFDVLHSIRARNSDYILSSTFGVHLIDRSLDGPLRSFSHRDLSNVHSVDPIDDKLALVTNTGMDELLLVELPNDDQTDLRILKRLDTAALFGYEKKLPYEDRRDRSRVSASDDWTHLNCAHIKTVADRRLAYCALFHPGTVLVLDITDLDNWFICDRFENTGKMIHSSIPIEEKLFVCSSAESHIHTFDLTSKTCLERIPVPYNAWPRSARPFGGDVVFTAEKDRSPDIDSKGYAARMNVNTGKLCWFLDLDTAGPFDIEVALPWKDEC